MKTPCSPILKKVLRWSGPALITLQLSAWGATLTNRYSFETDASDSVGGKHGTLVNATVSGGQAQLLSPLATPSSDTVNGQYVELPDDLLINYSAITIETWVTPFHDDFTGGAFWNRIWDFGNLDGTAGTHSFWFRGGNSSAVVSGDMFYPGGFSSIAGAVLPNGTESHIVWTSDPTSQRGRIYINGVLIGVNDAFTASPAAMGSTTNNWLGRSQFSGDTYWMGFINEFRIYQGELNPLEAAANYAVGPDNLGAPGNITNLAIQVASPITVDSSENALVWASAEGLAEPVNIANSSIQVIYSSGNSGILTVNNRGVVTGVASGTASIIASYAGLSATQSVTVIAVPTTMKHRYSFTTDANDSVGGRHGSTWGNAVFANGQVVLDGVAGSYVDLPPQLISPANIANKAVTLEAWATFNAGQGAWTRLFDFGTSSGADGGYYLFMTPSGGGTARAAVSGTLPGYSSPGEDIANAEVLLGRTNVHVAVVFNPNPSRSILALYVDGSLRQVVTTTKPFTAIQNNASYLGRALYSGDPWLAGAIDEFRIYDGELDRFQLAASFQSGPNTPNFNPGTFQSFVLSVSGSASPISLNQVRQLGAILNFSAATNINLLQDVNLTLTSSDTNVLTITSPGGLITATGVGSATVTAAYRRIEGAVTNVYSQTTNLTVVAPVATLVHRYNFNETSGSTVLDLVGTAHGLVRAGTNQLGVTNATWAGGQLIINTNTTLGATDTYVDLPAGIISSLGADATFEVWATVRDGGSWARLFDFGSVPSSPTNAAQPNIFLSRGAGNTTPRYDWVNGNVNANAAWANGSTAHFVVTHSGTDGAARLYRDGALVASSATQNLPLSSINDIYCFIGRSIYSWPISLPGGYFDPYFVGAFDEFRIYQGLLTAQQIAANYAAGPDQLAVPELTLSYSVSNGVLTLIWPVNADGFLPYVTSVLGSGASWSPVGGTPTQVGDNYQLPVTIGSSNGYFRLQK